MAKILLIYSTTDGHTRKICLRIKQWIEALGDEVNVVDVEAVQSIGLQDFDKIVIGASIRYGKHNKRVYRLIKQYREALETRPNAFFSVNLVARKPEKRVPENNPYLRKFLGDIDWQPRNLEVFAGKLDYQRYGILDRFIIRLIMRITHGPTDPQANIEFTDWAQVEEFAGLVHAM